MDKSMLKRLADAQQEYMVRMRREFHRHPEIAGEEYHTREVLIREIEGLGLPYRKLEGTGLIAVIKGGKPGKHKVLRADIDGLQVPEEEENLKGKKACISCVEGLSHACGHDAHTAMLLGTMKVLAAVQEEIEGTVYCCFEEGEERSTGVAAMLEALKDYPIGECFALHVYNKVEAGKLNVEPGPRMAGTVRIGFCVHGRGGHGSRPDQAVNPIIPAAHIITQLDGAFANQLDAEETVTLSICVLKAGEIENSIPEQVYIGGTARFFSREEGEKALQIINKIAKNTADSHNCQVSFTPKHRVCLFPVINGRQAALGMQEKVKEICGDVLAPCGRWYASEDYSRYLERYPGSLGFLGIRNEAAGSGAAHHNGKFDIDESVLALGALTELAFVFGSQDGQAPSERGEEEND